jgi:hypothetical protein
MATLLEATRVVLEALEALSKVYPEIVFDVHATSEGREPQVRITGRRVDPRDGLLRESQTSLAVYPDRTFIAHDVFELLNSCLVPGLWPGEWAKAFAGAVRSGARP